MEKNQYSLQPKKAMLKGFYQEKLSILKFWEFLEHIASNLETFGNFFFKFQSFASSPFLVVITKIEFSVLKVL